MLGEASLVDLDSSRGGHDQRWQACSIAGLIHPGGPVGRSKDNGQHGWREVGKRCRIRGSERVRGEEEGKREKERCIGYMNRIWSQVEEQWYPVQEAKGHRPRL